MECHPGGLVADFKKYFDQLPPDDLKVKSLLNPRCGIQILTWFCFFLSGLEGKRKGCSEYSLIYPFID
jgi:hypothetical protein